MVKREHGREQVNSFGAAEGFIKIKFYFREKTGKLFTMFTEAIFGRFLAKMTIFTAKSKAKYLLFSAVVNTNELYRCQYALVLVWLSEQVNIQKTACSLVFTLDDVFDRFFDENRKRSIK